MNFPQTNYGKWIFHIYTIILYIKNPFTYIEIFLLKDLATFFEFACWRQSLSIWTSDFLQFLKTLKVTIFPTNGTPNESKSKTCDHPFACHAFLLNFQRRFPFASVKKNVQIFPAKNNILIKRSIHSFEINLFGGRDEVKGNQNDHTSLSE